MAATKGPGRSGPRAIRRSELAGGLRWRATKVENFSLRWRAAGRVSRGPERWCGCGDRLSARRLPVLGQRPRWTGRCPRFGHFRPGGDHALDPRARSVSRGDRACSFSWQRERRSMPPPWINEFRRRGSGATLRAFEVPAGRPKPQGFHEGRGAGSVFTGLPEGAEVAGSRYRLRRPLSMASSSVVRMVCQALAGVSGCRTSK